MGNLQEFCLQEFIVIRVDGDCDSSTEYMTRSRDSASKSSVLGNYTECKGKLSQDNTLRWWQGSESSSGLNSRSGAAQVGVQKDTSGTQKTLYQKDMRGNRLQ